MIPLIHWPLKGMINIIIIQQLKIAQEYNLDNITDTFLVYTKYCLNQHYYYIYMLPIQGYIITSAPNIYYGVTALGAIFVLFRLFIMLRGILRVFIRKKQHFSKVYGDKSWVLVTGSSQGIGKEFALQFAAQGLNVILLARTQSKLKALRQQILGLYPQVQVEIIVADLSEEGRKQKIEDVLPALNRFSKISIVVNNAGSDIFDNYASLPPRTIVDLINTNCFAVAAICYKFIPYFEARIRQTGHKCGFINVGSLAGEIPIPMLNVYSASKAYVVQLTNNLSKQYPAINWLVLNPSEVSTAMTCYKEDIFTVSSTKCVAGALRDFGYQAQTNGALTHKIQGYYLRNLSSGHFNLVWSKFFVRQREEIYKKQ